MPTGYTACIDEKDADFETFVWTCARAFGALITMRDEPSDAPIPFYVKPDTRYIDGRLAELVKKRERIEAARPADLVKERYERMKERVLRWKPPTFEHEKLKEFMLEQLETGKPYPVEVHALAQEHRSGEVLRTDLLAEIDNEIARLSKDRAKDLERASQTNRWLERLRESVPLPAPMAKKETGT